MTIQDVIVSGKFDVYVIAKVIGLKDSAVSVLRKFVSVIQNMDDVITFMKIWEEYKFNTHKIFDATCDVHEHKIVHNQMSLEDFCSVYKSNKQCALSVLFQHTISVNDVTELSKKNVQASVIYNEHMIDRFVPLYRLIPKITILRETLKEAY